MTGQEKLIMERLKEPFHPESIQWRPGFVKGERALALAYLDARAIQDRLDEVMGLDWQCKNPWSVNGTLACEIGLLIEGEWRWRGDGAGQTDVEGEKGAFTDAFKRAAVRWGIGRYLYELENIWVDYDPQTKKLKGKPPLPEWAKPKVRPPEELRRRALAILEPEAKLGAATLARAWEILSPDMRRACKEDLPRLKEVASAAAA